MSRESTRQGAPKTTAPPRVFGRRIREWLEALTAVFHLIRAVAFDTKVESPRVPGSAAKAARSELHSPGFDVSGTTETLG